MPGRETLSTRNTFDVRTPDGPLLPFGRPGTGGVPLRDSFPHVISALHPPRSRTNLSGCRYRSPDRRLVPRAPEEGRETGRDTSSDPLPVGPTDDTPLLEDLFRGERKSATYRFGGKKALESQRASSVRHSQAINVPDKVFGH